MKNAIEVAGLAKRYGSVVAVNDLSFAVPAGSVFAFLGTNGAGKSTTIACLTTTTSFDRGAVRVAGADVVRDPGAVRQRIGVVFQESLMDAALTARENLQARARLYRIEAPQTSARIAELADLIDLTAFLDRRYGRLSGGQRRRADIARALLHEPMLLFLDEPTAGLDPASRAAVWSTIRLLRERRGLTVFLTTHYMEETEEADEVCVVDAGILIAKGSPHALRSAHSSSILTVTTRDAGGLSTLLESIGVDATAEDDVVMIHVDGADQALSILTMHASAVVDFEFQHGRMDDVFLALTAGRNRGVGR